MQDKTIPPAARISKTKFKWLSTQQQIAFSCSIDLVVLMLFSSQVIFRFIFPCHTGRRRHFQVEQAVDGPLSDLYCSFLSHPNSYYLVQEFGLMYVLYFGRGITDPVIDLIMDPGLRKAIPYFPASLPP